MRNKDGSGRGRQADSPTAIPPRGWKDVLWRCFKEVGDDRVTLIAAGATYFLLLSLFPTMSAMVSIYGLFADAGLVEQHVAALAGIVPAGGLAIISEQLQRITAQPSGTLGWALVVSVGVALWGASSGVKTMFEAMNIAYDEREERNFFVLNATALLFTLGGIVAALIIMTVVVGIPFVLEALGLGGGIEWLLWIGGYVVLALALIFGLAMLYRFGPSRNPARWRWITPGALLATAVIGVLSAGFSWYASNFANYDETYGSLGGLIGFLFWMWVSIMAVIVGAELNAELEHQTARDSTIGEDLPMGARDATMADTLGESAAHPAERDVPDPRSFVYHSAGPRPPPLPLRYTLPAVVGLMFLKRRKTQRQ